MLPNFLIIGAAKAGTTALYDALIQHPDIFMNPDVKESNFFALEGNVLNYAEESVQGAYLDACITEIKPYLKQFDSVLNEKAVGEASPLYLYSTKACRRIKYYVPDVRLIAILRNPVERAYSNFLHHVRENLETTADFSEAVQLEDWRFSMNWWWGFHYVRAGLYYKQLRRYFETFDRSQIRVYLYDDFSRQPSKVLQDIFGFLEVEENFIPDMSIRRNVSGIPRNRLMHNLVSNHNILKDITRPFLPVKFRRNLMSKLKNKNLAKPSLSCEVRQELISLFKADILQLQDLLERDLSGWFS